MKKQQLASITLATLITSSIIPSIITKADTPTPKNASQSVYRIYNKNTGEHFYTTSVFERNSLVKGGWNFEGKGWSAPNQGTAVYRVYNPNAKGGDHYYTASQYEAQSLVKTGWKWDNGAKPVFYSGGTSPVYVAFNPNATASGSHNYTSSNFEQNSLLRSGWKFGKVQFYGINTQATIENHSVVTPTQTHQFTKNDYGKVLASVAPIFNGELEQSLLKQLNAYRAHYGRSAITIHSELDKFAHDNAAWSENIANKVAVENNAHSYFQQNGPTLFQKGFQNIGENATGIQFTYNINANNILSPSITTKDEVYDSGPKMNIDYLNQIQSHAQSMDSLAYSLIYGFGDDGQPIGYDGTTAATQGSAHKQSLLSNTWTSVGFGIGISKDGNIHIWIDLAA